MFMYEQLSTVIILAGAFGLILYTMVKRKKDGVTTGNTALDVMGIAIPIITKAMEELEEMKEDGEVSADEFIDVVTKRVLEVIQIMDFTEAEKALFTYDLIRMLVGMLLKPVVEKDKDKN